MNRKILAVQLAAIFLAAAMAAADDIALTVYNSDLGVVRETRTLEFSRGDGTIAFTDVPASIDATSVVFEMTGKAGKVEILEQNFAYDLVSPEKIYQKYIDQAVDIITEKGELFSGVLISFRGDQLVIRQADGTIRLIARNWVRDVTMPDLPEGLITRPTLFWLYRSDFSGRADAVVGYQTAGIEWHAEYVGVLAADESRLGLNGWVSIDNRSGKTYKNATLKVVAGDINRAGQRPVRMYEGGDEYAMAAKAASFEEKTFFEYHLYTLPRRATIADNEIKQVTMFDPATARVARELRYLANPGQEKVNVLIKMKNDAESGLGMPLPAGRVRIFKADTDGSLILLGEDAIDHTARNEELKLQIGQAFDVVGETTDISRRRISDKVSETDFRIEIRNQKKEPVTVVVEKFFGGFWEITSSSADYVKKSAQKVEWKLDVAPESKTVIDATVRETYR